MKTHYFHKKNTIFIHVTELKNIKDLDKLIKLFLNIKSPPAYNVVVIFYEIFLNWY
jgi:hypothetical protein